MRIKITKDNPEYPVGIVLDTDRERAIKLCEDGVAVPVRERKGYEKAVER